MAAGVLSDFITQLQTITRQVKVAGETKKRAEDPPTSHPVGDADDMTQPADLGAHGKEVEREATDQVGETAVAKASPTNEPNLTGQGVDVTTPNQSPSGGEPKGTLSDPGTSHPATSNDGQKYGSAGEAIKASNDLLNRIATLNKAAAAPAKAATTPAATNTPPVETKAAEAGKAAADQALSAAQAALTPEQLAIVDNMQKAAAISADRVAQYLRGVHDYFAKKSEAEGGASESEPEPSPAGAADSAPPSPGPEGGAGAGQPSKEEVLALIVELMTSAGIGPEELMAAMSGGAGAGGGGGGMPPAAAMPPEAGGGMMPMASEGAKKASAGAEQVSAEIDKMAKIFDTLPADQRAKIMEKLTHAKPAK